MNSIKRTSTALVAVTALLIVAATTVASPAFAATASKEDADAQGWVNIMFMAGLGFAAVIAFGLWSLSRHQNRVFLKQQAADEARQANARQKQTVSQVQVRGGTSDQQIVQGGRPDPSSPESSSNYYRM